MLIEFLFIKVLLRFIIMVNTGEDLFFPYAIHQSNNPSINYSLIRQGEGTPNHLLKSYLLKSYFIYYLKQTQKHPLHPYATPSIHRGEESRLLSRRISEYDGKTPGVLYYLETFLQLIEFSEFITQIPLLFSINIYLFIIFEISGRTKLSYVIFGIQLTPSPSQS